MKRIKYLLLSVALLTFVSGCSKKSNPAPAATISISLKLNGSAKTSSVVAAEYSKSGDALVITGSFGSAGLVLDVIDPKAGSFDIASGAAAATYAPDANINDTYVGTTGTVTITSFTNSSVAGTFAFTGSTISGTTGAITDGTFAAKVTSGP